ncbi:MAG: zf-TFIIB domain-containing protein [Burkholderia sp.]|jgi:Zn-finger nucleic acid-binding protein|uniref:TFIIB-type zinc ribbon-containing protein n=1 Tax=Burkholderia sp. TaxID=36773 RepID=UPI002823C568|nr:zf-TFIIB domain-containing protein [Burkholderia sp.]MDR0241231.1 zf-TFIIB domain-containing protein [Burkholderia sp.]
MKCPVCKTPDLLMAERQSIEIDYCPTCRGVWLDRGELDKLIARETGDAPARRDAAPTQHTAPAQRGRDDGWGRDGRSHDERHRHDGQRRKKSVFDLFDFD